MKVTRNFRFRYCMSNTYSHTSKLIQGLFQANSVFWLIKEGTELFLDSILIY